MKYSVILIFSCLFTLYLATAAGASDFTDNTCYEVGANCQTDLDWTRGWCEAAISQDWIVGSVDECVVGEAITLTPEQRQARIQARIDRQNQAQNQNADSSASRSRQSSGGGQGKQESARALERANDSNVDASIGQGANCTDGDCASSPERGSVQSDTQWEQCQSYRVMRTDPTRFVCVRPLQLGPFGELPADYE